MSTPELVSLREPPATGAWIRCPGCQNVGLIDDDQLHGRVSIQCENCSYHETHDLSGGGS